MLTYLTFPGSFLAKNPCCDGHDKNLGSLGLWTRLAKNKEKLHLCDVFSYTPTFTGKKETRGGIGETSCELLWYFWWQERFIPIDHGALGETFTLKMYPYVKNVCKINAIIVLKAALRLQFTKHLSSLIALNIKLAMKDRSLSW